MTTFNAFLEDTCVLATASFLLTRGSWLRVLETPRPRKQTLLLGAIFTIVGALQNLTPEARYPYAPSTLIVTFATLVAGGEVGLLSALGISLSALALQEQSATLLLFLASLLSVPIAALLRRTPNHLSLVLLAGVLTQSSALVLEWALSLWSQAPFSPLKAVISIPANALACPLLVLIVRDARRAAETERLTHEAEKARLLATETQLSALRARLNPHFLYNALSSIAALCRIAPEKAERAVVRLGTLLRRALELNSKEPICLREELEAARAYAEIEGYRFGNRLQFQWKIDESALSAGIPALSLVTLIENAVTHGIGKRPGPGTVTILVRGGRRTLVAVADNGIGIDHLNRQPTAPSSEQGLHGLGMVAGELRLLFGPKARVRLFSKPGVGTLAVLVLPGEPTRRS